MCAHVLICCWRKRQSKEPKRQRFACPRLHPRNDAGAGDSILPGWSFQVRRIEVPGCSRADSSHADIPQPNDHNYHLAQHSTPRFSTVPVPERAIPGYVKKRLDAPAIQLSSPRPPDAEPSPLSGSSIGSDTHFSNASFRFPNHPGVSP
jgi:hypothetical protein